MFRYYSQVLAVIVLIRILLLSNLLAQQITGGQISEHIHFLASDSLKGRKPGTAEDKFAANYIRDAFKAYGLELSADKGFQYFEVVTELQIGGNNHLIIDGSELQINEDYTPLAFSGNGTCNAKACFAGYGFDISLDSLKWNDYDGLDVKGNWVIILRGDPEPDKAGSFFIPYSEEREKVNTAIDKGAAGVIFVSGVKVNEKDELESLYFDKSQSGASIPVIQLKRGQANLLLQNHTIENLEAKINTNHQPFSFHIPTTIKAEINVIPNRVRTQNVIALLPGADKKLENEIIVIGAHYDHLGLGGPGSGSRLPDTIAVHNGADDNASGVAGVLELARLITQKKSDFKRSILFISFGAEELGLIGSKYFMQHPVSGEKKIIAMINLDMIGRLDEEVQNLSIGGTGTSEEAVGILDRLNKGYHFNLSFSPEGYGPSDHASFYSENIPVFFITTGAHEDYHTPFDDIGKINYHGAEKIVSFLYDLVKNIADNENALTFLEAGPKGGSKGGYRFKVTLGIMPGFGESEIPGLRVDGVRGNGPAYHAGMKKGDIIVALGGKVVNNIYDYMFWLKKLEPGQTVTVDVMRDEKKKVLLIQL